MWYWTRFLMMVWVFSGLFNDAYKKYAKKQRGSCWIFRLSPMNFNKNLSVYCSPSNNNSLATLHNPVPTALVDYNDTHVLDFEPSLRTLCILAVIRFNLSQAEIPQQLRFEIRMMLQANAISRPLTNTG